jgi:crossover junction endodeoxyribonuclease RusA
MKFFASGIPRPKGSAKAFVRNGHAAICQDNDSDQKVWATQIVAAARVAEVPLYAAPVSIAVSFYLPRPQTHYGSKGLKATAPALSIRKPDLDKLLRCVLDALTGIAYEDDARIARVIGTKFYADPRPGAAITIETMQ